MKIVAISGDRVYYRIGDDLKNSFWYRSDKVKDIQVQKGDEVEITFEKDAEGINILNSIKVTSMAPDSVIKPPQGGTGETSTELTPKKVWRQKSAEEGEEIRRQAVGKMVAESVKGLTPQSSIDVLLSNIEKLYILYDRLTKG